ncbi:MAG: class I SAM-dependent methyltransferase [Anaerolineae bacterium]|nr:class I SAM-dependent methyltransferase [Anaerolineae bacterium]
MDYRALYERVGAVTGWDFSRLSVIVEGRAWDFYEQVAGRCDADTLLLDLGTGGGEKLLKIAGAARLLVGVDVACAMLETARRNREAAGAGNVRFLRMDAAALQFPDGFFDVVSCRQGAFDVPEVARVLRPGGVFLTQQVAGGDKLNIKQAFGRGQGYGGHTDGPSQEAYIEAFGALGFDVQAFEYDATEYYATPDDLIFLLHNTPIIPDFGRDAHDFEALARFIDEHTTGKGIKTNSKRYMIIACKL